MNTTHDGATARNTMHPGPRMGSGFKQALKRASVAAAAAVALIAAISGGTYLYVESDGNFHALAQGALYRSRQLSGTELREAIHAYGIRSIVNLRGAHPGSAWYEDELAVSAADHVAHYDYAISARRPVTPAQLAQILRIIRDAPKPVLAHCMSGADRTGLVSAAYLFSHGTAAAEAERQLSLGYGHFPYLGSRTRAMDDSFNAFVAAQASISNNRLPTGTEARSED